MGTTGTCTASPENRRLTRRLLDGLCHRRLLVETIVIRERLSHPYDHMDLDEAQSRSVCPEKWRRLCEYTQCLRFKVEEH